MLGENKSDLAADTLSVILTARTLKLHETKQWLLQEELKMPYKLHRIYMKRPTCRPITEIWTLLSYQPRVTVKSCFVYKVIMDL